MNYGKVTKRASRKVAGEMKDKINTEKVATAVAVGAAAYSLGVLAILALAKATDDFDD